MLSSKNQIELVSEMVQRLAMHGHRGFGELIDMLPEDKSKTIHQKLLEKLAPLTNRECDYIIKAYKGNDPRFHISTARNLIYRVIK